MSRRKFPHFDRLGYFVPDSIVDNNQIQTVNISLAESWNNVPNKNT